MAFRQGALLVSQELRLHVCAKLPGAADHGRAVGQALALEGRERGGHVVGVPLKRSCQRRRINSGLRK